MLNTKQYVIEFGTSMVLYTISVPLSIYFILSHPESPWVIWIAVLPVIPTIMATTAVIRALKRLDELQQKIQLMSFAITFAIIGITTLTYGFLENVGYPRIPFIWIFPFMIMIWGLTTPVVSRFYR